MPDDGLREALTKMRESTSRDEAYDLGWNDAVQAVTIPLVLVDRWPGYTIEAQRYEVATQ